MKILGKDYNNKPIEVIIEGDKISDVIYLNEADYNVDELNYVIPGFIDMHTHGGYDFDWISGDVEKMKDYLYKIAKLEGTTSVAGTTITTSHDKIMNTLTNLNPYINKKMNGANFVGFHLEGPHINPLKKGAHPVEYMSGLTIDHIKGYSIVPNLFKVITFAPELSTVEVTQYGKDQGISMSAGHTMATGEIIREHLAHGLNSITHFNNAMPKSPRDADLTMHEEGITNDSIYTEFINDGVHNSRELAMRLHNEKAKDKLVLITDSLHIKGLEDGDYPGPNWMISKRDGAAWTPDGTLNGSVYTMLAAFQDWVKDIGASMEEAVHVTSTNAAKALKLNKGKVEKGYDADLVIINNELEIEQTIVNGEEIK